jgi:hypothetical protein
MIRNKMRKRVTSLGSFAISDIARAPKPIAIPTAFRALFPTASRSLTRIVHREDPMEKPTAAMNKRKSKIDLSLAAFLQPILKVVESRRANSMAVLMVKMGNAMNRIKAAAAPAIK